MDYREHTSRVEVTESRQVWNVNNIPSFRDVLIRSHCNSTQYLHFKICEYDNCDTVHKRSMIYYFVFNKTVKKMDPSCVYIESVSTVFESMIAMKGRTGFSKSAELSLECVAIEVDNSLHEEQAYEEHECQPLSVRIIIWLMFCVGWNLDIKLGSST